MIFKARCSKLLHNMHYWILLPFMPQGILEFSFVPSIRSSVLADFGLTFNKLASLITMPV